MIKLTTILTRDKDYANIIHVNSKTQMTDSTTTKVKPSITSQSTTMHDVPLSTHAEDVLAHAVGNDISLVNDSQNIPVKTVQQVLSELVGDKDELSITLEYGTGESGVDQASWDIEMSALQRAFLRKQKKAQIDALSDKLQAEIDMVKRSFEPSWIERTNEFRNLMKLFDQPSVTRQEIDDFQHQVFGKNEYLHYLESVINAKDVNRLLNSVANLRQMAKQFEADIESLIDPAHVDNNKLADEIIYFEGDIEKLSRELERDFSSAVFRRAMAESNRIYNIIGQEFLTKFKIWAHSFDLNLREVLSTEISASNGAITSKSQKQLKEMLQSGAEQINSILQVL